MVRYWIVYGIVLLICLVYSGQGERKKRKSILCASLVLVFFSGLRSWWYGDLVKYYTRFLRESGQSLVLSYRQNGFRNLGLAILNKILYLTFGKYGYDVLIFLIACFSVFTLAMVVKKYSFSAYWSYLMYLSMGFYTFTFSGLKQTIAMGFICLSMIALLEDNFYRFLFFVGIGALFHAPALIFLVAYPFSKKKIDGFYFIYVAAIILLSILYRDRLAFLLEDAYYSDTSDISGVFLQAKDYSVGGRFIGMMLIMLMATLLRIPNKNDRDYAKVFNLMVIAASIQTMSIFDNTYSRLADYYYQFVVLFVPMFMQPITSKDELKYRRVGILGTNRATYFIIGVATTLFSIWFFNSQLPGLASQGDFLFFWEKNGHLLYWE